MAERIDHGVRAIEDPNLVRQLAHRSIPLGICPTSNVVLGVYPNRASHPIEALRRAGVPVTINTDDPALLRTTLVGEYAETARTFSWDVEILRTIARTSIEASFCPEEMRRELLHALDSWRPAIPRPSGSAPKGRRAPRSVPRS
jgi:adenosine deaminase